MAFPCRHEEIARRFLYALLRFKKRVYDQGGLDSYQTPKLQKGAI